MCSMTTEEQAHARFRQAMLTGRLEIIEAAARQLPTVALDDALRILRVFAEKRDARFDRAAARFAARLTAERRLDLAEARYVLALVEALPQSPSAITALLGPYCDERGS
jgi:hypothetical protein